MINKHLTGVLLLLFVVLIPLIVLPEEREMTLEEAINISLKENPSMQKAESYIRQAEEGKNEVRGGLLPRIDVGVNYTRQGNIPVLDLTPYGVDFVQNVSSPDNYKYYVSLTQLLFNYQMLTDYEMAKLNILNMDYQYDITKQSVVYNVSKSYYNVLTGNSLAELTKETVTQYELHLNNSQKLYKQGSVPKYDVLRVDVDLAKAMENDITARNNVELSKASFNNSLGINLSSPVNIKECLKYEPWKIEYKKSLDYALANRPEIKQMDTLLSIAEKKISYAKAEGYPNLTLSSSYYGQNSTLIQQANGWNLVVGASLPIFHGGAINARIKKAEEGLEQSKQDEALLLQAVELEVKQSYLNLNAAAEKIEVNSKNVKQAEESMRMADLRYKGGVATIQEVLDTQTSLTRAKSDYIKALHDYEMAKTDLKKAMGMLVEIGKQETGGKVIFTFNLKEISHRTKISYIKNM